MAGDDATIVFATALSQQPCIIYDSTGGKTFHAPHSFEPLLEFAGIDPRSCSAEQVMSEEFHLRFASHEAAERGREQLLKLRIGDEVRDEGRERWLERHGWLRDLPRGTPGHRGSRARWIGGIRCTFL